MLNLLCRLATRGGAATPGTRPRCATFSPKTSDFSTPNGNLNGNQIITTIPVPAPATSSGCCHGAWESNAIRCWEFRSRTIQRQRGAMLKEFNSCINAELFRKHGPCRPIPGVDNSKFQSGASPPSWAPVWGWGVVVCVSFSLPLLSLLAGWLWAWGLLSWVLALPGLSRVCWGGALLSSFFHGNQEPSTHSGLRQG